MKLLCEIARRHDVIFFFLPGGACVVLQICIRKNCDHTKPAETVSAGLWVKIPELGKIKLVTKRRNGFAVIK